MVVSLSGRRMATPSLEVESITTTITQNVSQAHSNIVRLIPFYTLSYYHFIHSVTIIGIVRTSP